MSADADTDADATGADPTAIDATPDQAAALREAAAAASEPLEYDDLYAWRDEEGYGFAVPGLERDGLDAETFEAVATDHPEFLTNWYYWRRTVDLPDEGGPGAGRHYRAFLRWLEGAPTPSTPEWETTRAVPQRYETLVDGVVREWGQLRIETTVAGDGTRQYDLRHVADADEDGEALTVHEDPLAARELGRFDDRDRYRPLRTAPSLPTGWVFPDIVGRDVVDAVETFYPATVSNWHLERADALDVTHWRETAERQTGIYDIIDELDPEAVAWIAESCCVDSQCTKRREWEFDEGHELGVDGGEGAYPCREPCSLVVAAARKWTTLEREESRTYEFELTPSEKEQLEALVEAVADGRVEEIREADVYEGANRYRTRFLRAKRMDEAGNLSGTPTDPDHGDHGDHDDDHGDHGDGDHDGDHGDGDHDDDHGDDDHGDDDHGDGDHGDHDDDHGDDDHGDGDHGDHDDDHGDHDDE
jgi:hypothetical protein